MIEGSAARGGLIAGYADGGERQGDLVRRNIQAIAELQQKTASAQTPQDRLADRITAFFGSMTFVWLHVAWFGAWILLNAGLIHAPP